MKKNIFNIILIVFLLITLPPSISVCSNPELNKVKIAKVHIKMLEVGIQHLSVDIGRIPTTDEGLLLLIDEPPVNSGWQGPYIEKRIPLDPWGKKYIYFSPAEYGDEPFSLYSSGKNTVDDQGGVDDITNWREINYKYYGELSNKSAPLLFSIAVIIVISVILYLRIS